MSPGMQSLECEPELTGSLIGGRNHRGPSQSCEDLVRRHLSAIQEEPSPEPDHADTLISDL